MSDELAIVYILLDWGGNVEDEKIMTPNFLQIKTNDMPTYGTSLKKPLLTNQYRFVVYYEDDTGCHKTFATWATLASIAVARTIGWLDANNPDWLNDPYYLTPKVDRIKQVNFEI